MAVTWGAWEYAGGNGMRVGIDAYSGSAVDTNSATYTYKVDFWTGNQYSHSGDTQSLPYSWPGVSSTLNYTNSEGTGTSTKRATYTVTYTYTTWGSSPGSRTVLIGPLSGAYHGASPSHSRATTIPARPYAAPYAPSSVTATRNSDSQTTLSWAGSATAQRPITNYTVQIATYTGSAWSAWTGYSDTTGTSMAIPTNSNHIYQFQVRANNSVGSSGFVKAPQWIYNTPSAPTGVAANASGSDIVITWGSAAYVSGDTTHKIERKTDAGAWTPLASGIAQATTTYTDPSPPGSTNLYRVATVNSYVGSSSWVQANAVVLADCWIWDGASEIPAFMYLWDGAAEIPLSIDLVT